MSGDHRRILATGIARLRAKIKYRPVVFELMPAEFTLLQLQRSVEALAGRLVHKQNFRRLIEQQQLVVPPLEWATFAEDVDAILDLKRGRNAVVLAHNYQTPEIFHGVADIVGDSLLLAREATKVDADVIVLAGVHFMAETAKLLNPDKTVLIPDLACRVLAGGARSPPADVRLMRQRLPGRARW